MDFTNMTDGDYPTKKSLFYHVVFKNLFLSRKKIIPEWHLNKEFLKLDQPASILTPQVRILQSPWH